MINVLTDILTNNSFFPKFLWLSMTYDSCLIVVCFAMKRCVFGAILLKAGLKMSRCED